MRSLVPYFFVSTYPVGWKCSVCGKVFRVPLNVMSQPTSKPNDDIRLRFEEHSCLAYRDELDRKRQGAVSLEEPDSGS